MTHKSRKFPTFFAVFYYLSEPMLKAGFKRHFLVVILLLCAMYGKGQTVPSFSSTPVETGTYGLNYSYSIVTSDVEDNARTIKLLSGTLPDGLVLIDQGDGTAIISGTVNEVNIFPITLAVDDTDGQATQSFTITISKATATITLSTLTATYSGTSHAVTATTIPAGLTVDITYDGFAALPVNAGTYAVVATINDPNYTGSSGNSFIINKATATVTLSALSATYDGNMHTATVITSPAGLTVNTTYNNSAALPINAGNYAVATSINDTNYQGSGNGTLVISQAIPIVIWNAPAAITYGTPLSTTQLNASANIVGTFTYTPAIGKVLDAGINQVLSVSFTPSDAVNYSSVSSTQTQITVNKATANITLSSLTATYDSNTHSVIATTSPAGLTVVTTYNGSTALPVNAGDYAVQSTISDTNYVGNTTGTLTINKATPVINWTTPAAITYGTALSAAQLNASSSVSGNFTYSPAAGTILNAGLNQALSVNFAPIDATNYNFVNGTTTQVTVNKATATVSLASLTAIYDGNTHPATITTSPAGLTVITTYNGLSTLPINASSYSIVSTINELNYQGSISGTLVISKATPTISWTTPAAITYGTTLSASQLNATASTAGTFTYSPAAGTLLNSGPNQTLSVNFLPTDATNYNTVNNTQTQITVNKATAIVTLSNLTATYDGSTHPSTVTTSPAGLNVTTTYNGSSSLPTNAGSYTVVSTITESNYQGSISNTLVISKATPAISWTVPAAITYGTPLSALQLNATASATGTFTYSPSSGTILNAGPAQTLSVNFTPTDATNYTTVSNTQIQITVNKATATVALSNLTATYNSSSHPATVTTSPAGLTVTTTYNGVAALPVNAGSYTVTSTINETNYQGSTSGTLVISKATPVVSWTTPGSITYGTVLSSTQLNATATTGGTFAYSPGIGTILNAGANQTLSVNFTPSDAANYTTVNNTLTQVTVNKATATVTLSNLTKTYSGTTQSATVTTSPAGLTVIITYNGSTSAPVNASNYTVIATINELNYQGNTSGTLTINKETPTVTWNTPAAITYGTPLSATQLSASANVSGTFSYAPDAGTILNAGSRTLSVNFTPNDAANYNPVNGVQRSITVNKATPTITWSDPLPIRINVPLSATQLNATANVTGTFTYTPPSGTSFSTDGTYTLSVNFTPGDNANYNSVTGTQVHLIVSAKDNPVITWTAPAAITYGTPLGAAQLNATASVAGTFNYTPAQGTILNAGNNRILKVDFVPNDGVNFNTISKTIQLNINKATLNATASSASRTYGTANPAFSVAYSGFVNNEASAVLTTTPVVTCQAIASDNAGGIFATIPSGGVADNYSFNYINGTLTITKALLSIKPNDRSKLYGEDNPVLTLNYTGFVNGDPESVIDSSPITASTASKFSPVGTYPITASGGTDNNYNFNLSPGELTILKAPLTVRASDVSRAYGTVAPLPITYTGFINNETAVVLDKAPMASTSATIFSPVDSYPIFFREEDKGEDNNYHFNYIDGTLTITANNPPVLKSFQITTDEDTRFNLTYELFNQNVTDETGSYIAFIKILSLPINGTLSWKGNKVAVGDEIPSVNNNSFDNLNYIPNTDYNGNDSFGWNASDGTFLSNNPASITIKITAVNDPPVLSNIESESIKYSLGDKGVPITQKLTVSDVDNNFMHSAKITIAENYSSGDNLAAGSTMSSKIAASFNATTGELTLKGKDSKSNYEAALSGILFSSAVTGSATISSKVVHMVVNDSSANSNVASRIIEITEVFPELNIVNSFTPNNDGVNDQWDIINLDLYSKIKIAIVTREGIQVFSCNTSDCKWDGASNGTALPSGTYFYTIDLNDGKRKYQGTVTILK